MHELTCPTCTTAAQYNFSDYLHMCHFCNATFKLDIDTGQKEPFSDHYIVLNTIDVSTVKDLAMEWLKRLHHKPGLADKEFYITDIQGLSVPFWIISAEGHSVWKGLVKKYKHLNSSAVSPDYLTETGQFRRSYRWAISARNNICETWGFTRLHEPQENLTVDWDGFPLDSTFSRGRLTLEQVKSAYDSRHYFEFKYSNGLPILGVQVNEEEALRRAKSHIQLYHHRLSSLNVDYLLDNRTELEIAGIQLLHLPFWKVTYVFQPKSALRHFIKPREMQLLMDGYNKGILTGELAITYRDKVTVNAIVCAIATVIFLLLGNLWHPGFYITAIFALITSLASVYIGFARKNKEFEESIKRKSTRLSTPGKEGDFSSTSPSINAA